MPYTIRRIEPRDNATVEAIIRACLIEFGANREGCAWADPTLSRMGEIYTADNSAYWVIEDETGTIVGGMGIAPLEGEPEICELQRLYCIPEARGTGAAHILMKEGLAFARAHYRRCYLETMTAMRAACRFYEKYGFERLDEPLGNTGHFACDIPMVKDL